MRDLPVHPQSAAYLKSIGGDAVLHPDFGAGQWQGGPIGIPVTIARVGARLVPLHFTAYGDESYPGPHPSPTNAPVEGGRTAQGDRHVVVVDAATCTDYEAIRCPAPARRQLECRERRPLAADLEHVAPCGLDSADAAGLPILPGLVRYDEVASGVTASHPFATAISRKPTSGPPGTATGLHRPHAPRRWVCACVWKANVDLSSFDP